MHLKEFSMISRVIEWRRGVQSYTIKAYPVEKTCAPREPRTPLKGVAFYS